MVCLSPNSEARRWNFRNGARSVLQKTIVLISNLADLGDNHPRNVDPWGSMSCLSEMLLETSSLSILKNIFAQMRHLLKSLGVTMRNEFSFSRTEVSSCQHDTSRHKKGHKSSLLAY